MPCPFPAHELQNSTVFGRHSNGTTSPRLQGLNSHVSFSPSAVTSNVSGFTPKFYQSTGGSKSSPFVSTVSIIVVPRGCQFLHQPCGIPRNILFDQLTLLAIQCHKKLALERGADFWCCIIQDHVLAAVKSVSHDSKADTKKRKNTQIAGSDTPRISQATHQIHEMHF